MTPRPQTERGSATVYVAVLAALVSCVAAVVVVLGRVAVHRARVASAADFAALAAAASRASGEARGCRRAAEVADAHGAALDECDWDGEVVTVLVRLRVTGLAWIGSGEVTAESRAGPAGVTHAAAG